MEYKNYLNEEIKHLIELHDSAKDAEIRLYYAGEIFGLERAISLYEKFLQSKTFDNI